MASKKEGAQRVLDAQASRTKVRGRLLPAGLCIVLIGAGVTVLTRWQFGLATVLICGLLMQYAVERMNTILEASVATGIRDMGWDADTALTEETLDTIRRIAER
tara:strand:+ start:1208 stop:1519 length:312 start_codon:yes stop_codon:yes gene_type:complete